MNLIDLKSLIIGIASCALVLMLMGLSEGSNQKYQIFCGASLGTCSLLNTETGISKIILPKHFQRPDDHDHASLGPGNPR